MDSHFTVQELFPGCKLVLASGVHIVTYVEPSDTIPENCLIHHTGGAFECGYDTRFLRVYPMTFEVLS